MEEGGRRACVVFQLAAGLVFTHTGRRGEPARSRSTQKRDQSWLLFQPYPLSSVCARLRPDVGLTQNMGVSPKGRQAAFFHRHAILWSIEHANICTSLSPWKAKCVLAIERPRMTMGYFS